MREIRFRAWYRKTNSWQYFDLLSIRHADAEIHYERWGQYTGRKDKNGVDIYEGDIVHSDKPHGGTAPIEWGDDIAGFQVVTKPQWWNGASFKDFEVIGNIYENKELLNNVAN